VATLTTRTKATCPRISQAAVYLLRYATRSALTTPDIRGGYMSDSSESGEKTNNRPVYQAVFRVVLPSDTDSVVEDNVRTTVFDAIADVIRKKKLVYPEVKLLYKVELTTDYIEVL
jgi:hypothetical protein